MMKQLRLMLAVLGVVAVFMAPPSWAQQQVPPAAPGPQGDRAARFYNPQAVETLVGKVAAVNRRAPRRPGRPALVSLDLQTGQGIVKVLLGPADYLDGQAVKLAPGNQVEVKGVRHTRPKATIFIAGQVTKGGQVMQLRNDVTGRPLWAKAKMRPGPL